MTDLLPPSATPQERALAAVSERLDNLPVPLRSLWDVDRCPLVLLPYLAWTFSVDQWDEQWPEEVKRQIVKTALHQHRIKGSRAAVENAVSDLGVQAVITEWWEQSPQADPHTFTINAPAEENSNLDASLQGSLISAVIQAKPLRSWFEFSVSTHHPGNFHFNPALYPLAMIRETF